jgi:hypothetical protein
VREEERPEFHTARHSPLLLTLAAVLLLLRAKSSRLGTVDVVIEPELRFTRQWR